MVLHIHVPSHKDIDLVINKRCTEVTLIDKITDKLIAGDNEYGIVDVIGLCLIFILIIYATMTCCNMCRGKKLAQAVPCGGKFITTFIGSPRPPSAETVENTAINVCI
eukprot:TRINITY_DN4232_c0_g1_i1.p2 TRINITY_DN4232_c0_g1~~TRINITY_DN4232_c0_g1_i1.p2  ORF type:complete len:108 (+),score=8.15 TRINITY_DN4232_c0_g1_i1:1044-1367(+)